MIEESGLMVRPGGLTDAGVTSVRVIYSDLHGMPRGKDVPIGRVRPCGRPRPRVLRGDHGH